MSTTSKCCANVSVSQIVVGALVAVSVAAVVWTFLRRRDGITIDPLAEADRRINELESSLHRLQDNVSRIVVG